MSGILMNKYLFGRSLEPNAGFPVYLGYDISSGNQILIQQHNSETSELAENTFSLLKQVIPHNYLPVPKDFSKDEKGIFTIFDYPGYFFFSSYFSHFQQLDEIRACKIFYQICLSLRKLESENLLVKKLKPENFILSPSFEPCIFDFELTKVETPVSFAEFSQLRELLLFLLSGNKIQAQSQQLEGTNLIFSPELESLFQLLLKPSSDLTLSNILECDWIQAYFPLFSYVSLPHGAVSFDIYNYFKVTTPEPFFVPTGRSPKRFLSKIKRLFSKESRVVPWKLSWVEDQTLSFSR